MFLSWPDHQAKSKNKFHTFLEGAGSPTTSPVIQRGGWRKCASALGNLSIRLSAVLLPSVARLQVGAKTEPLGVYRRFCRRYGSGTRDVWQYVFVGRRHSSGQVEDKHRECGIVGPMAARSRLAADLAVGSRVTVTGKKGVVSGLIKSHARVLFRKHESLQLLSFSNCKPKQAPAVTFAFCSWAHIYLILP